MGLEPSTSSLERYCSITSTIQPIDTRSLHQRCIYSHKDILNAIFIKKRSIAALVTRWVFYPQGSTFILHWETRGRVRSWKYSHFTTSSIIERFPKKCSLRSTVQAGPILFYQVIGRLPRYVMLKYFWNRKSLFLLTFWTFWSLPEHCAIFWRWNTPCCELLS